MTILWGKDRDLDYWAALREGCVSDPEKRAMGLLASISDEDRFSFYCMAGMYPAMGNVTKRMYLVRRWTTVLELKDGRPTASWCILTKDRNVAPETDHVVAMKNILEGSELAFREVGNPFHYAHDPFRGRVEAKTAFPNRYLCELGPDPTPQRRSSYLFGDDANPDYNSEWNEDSSLLFRDQEGWVKALLLRAELCRRVALEKAGKPEARAAAWRQEFMRDALVERARDWVRIPEKKKPKLPATQFENMTGRAFGILEDWGAGGVTTDNAGTLMGAATTNTMNIRFTTNAATGWGTNAFAFA